MQNIIEAQPHRLEPMDIVVLRLMPQGGQPQRAEHLRDLASAVNQLTGRTVITLVGDATIGVLSDDDLQNAGLMRIPPPSPGPEED